MNEIVGWLDRHNISVIAVLATISLLIGAFALSYLMKRPLQVSLRQLASRLRLPYEPVLTITRVLLGALWVVVATLVLEIWGVNVGGVWTLLVSAATVVGVGFLATWTMVSNITASFFIAFWRPLLEVLDHLGWGRNMRWRATALRQSASATNAILRLRGRVIAAAPVP